MYRLIQPVGDEIFHSVTLLLWLIDSGYSRHKGFRYFTIVNSSCCKLRFHHIVADVQLLIVRYYFFFTLMVQNFMLCCVSPARSFLPGNFHSSYYVSLFTGWMIQSKMNQFPREIPVKLLNNTKKSNTMKIHDLSLYYAVWFCVSTCMWMKKL